MLFRYRNVDVVEVLMTAIGEQAKVQRRLSQASGLLTSMGEHSSHRPKWFYRSYSRPIQILCVTVKAVKVNGKGACKNKEARSLLLLIGNLPK